MKIIVGETFEAKENNALKFFSYSPNHYILHKFVSDLWVIHDQFKTICSKIMVYWVLHFLSIEVMVDIETFIKPTLALVAKAFSSIVFLVPGGVQKVEFLYMAKYNKKKIPLDAIEYKEDPCSTIK